MDCSSILSNVLKRQNKQVNKYLVLNIVVFVLAFSAFIASCFFINDKTIIYLSIINIVILFVALSFIYYATFGIIIPFNKQNKIFKKILSAAEKSIQGEVLNVKKHVTIDDGIVCDEVTVLIDKQEIVLTLFEILGIELMENNSYVFTTRLNYLLGVQNEE